MKAENLCIFYASKYHLSLVLLEYLKHNNIKKYNVVTFLEEGIKDEIIILEERSKTKINITNEVNFESTKEINEKEIAKKGNMIFIVDGKENYMKEANTYIQDNIKNTKSKSIKVINCYDFEKQRKHMTEILKENDKILYTTGEEKIEIAS